MLDSRCLFNIFETKELRFHVECVGKILIVLIFSYFFYLSSSLNMA